MDRQKIIVFLVITAIFGALLFYKVPAPDEKYTAQIGALSKKKNILIKFKEDVGEEKQKNAL